MATHPAAQAAIAGVGVALLPEMESAERYCLAWPTSRGNYPPPLQSFRDWLQQAAQDFMRDSVQV